MVIQSKEVVTSLKYETHLIEILEYSLETFGYVQTHKYFKKISQRVESLSNNYAANPECRCLATKSRMYRNIILDAHLIIYRITANRIEVLDIIHAASKHRQNSPSQKSTNLGIPSHKKNICF